MTLPDYHQYAHLINVLLGQGRLGDVEQELHKLFKQGYSLGKREGYELGLEKGWGIEQDKERTRGAH